MLEGVWRNHYPLLTDSVRMRGYAGAIADAIGSADVVVDVGSGTGILAILAAKAGAKKVYAVERDPNLVQIIRAACSDNHVTDTVEVLAADVLNLTASSFDLAPTVIVSELFGYFAPSERVHEISAHVAGMFQGNVRFLPHAYRLGAAPVEAANPYDGVLKDIAGADMRALARERTKIAYGRQVPAEDLTADEQWSPEILVTGPSPAQQTWTFTLAEPTTIDGIAVFFDVRLGRYSFSTSPRSAETSWIHMVVPCREPLTVAAGGRATATLSIGDVGDPRTWSCRIDRARGTPREVTGSVKGERAAGFLVD